MTTTTIIIIAVVVVIYKNAEVSVWDLIHLTQGDVLFVPFSTQNREYRLFL